MLEQSDDYSANFTEGETKIVIRNTRRKQETSMIDISRCLQKEKGMDFSLLAASWHA